MVESKSWNELFKEWANSKNYGIANIAKLCYDKGTKIPRTTLSDYLNGRVKSIAKSEYADILNELTGIDAIKNAYVKKSVSKRISISKKPDTASKLEELLNNINQLSKLVLLRTGKDYQPTTEERTEIFTDLINAALNQAVELATYYRENPKEVEKLTEIISKRINKEDAGYLISVLNAIFDKDRYKSWVLFADYSPRRKR